MFTPSRSSSTRTSPSRQCATSGPTSRTRRRRAAPARRPSCGPVTSVSIVAVGGAPVDAAARGMSVKYRLSVAVGARVLRPARTPRRSRSAPSSPPGLVRPPGSCTGSGDGDESTSAQRRRWEPAAALRARVRDRRPGATPRAARSTEAGRNEATRSAWTSASHRRRSVDSGSSLLDGTATRRSSSDERSVPVAPPGGRGPRSRTCPGATSRRCRHRAWRPVRRDGRRGAPRAPGRRPRCPWWPAAPAGCEPRRWSARRPRRAPRSARSRRPMARPDCAPEPARSRGDVVVNR